VFLHPARSSNILTNLESLKCVKVEVEGETLLFPARPLFEVQNPHCLVLMCGVLKSICLFIVSILDDYGFKSTNHCCGLNPPNKSFVYSFGIELIMGRHRVIIE
jgi:hypothetical protein